MAVVSFVAYASPREGSSITFTYNNASLLLTSITIVSGNNPNNPVILWYDDGSAVTTLKPGNGISSVVHTFGTPIKGTAGTNQIGKPTITWFPRFGAGHSLVPPSPVTTA